MSVFCFLYLLMVHFIPLIYILCDLWQSHSTYWEMVL